MTPDTLSLPIDTLVFDIETQNFFTDPGVGWNNYAALKISVVGVYSYKKDKYFCFEEHEMEPLAELFRESRRIIGFSMNHYDIPVLTNYFQAHPATRDVDLWKKERVDLLDEVELFLGKRISLSKLAEANLGVGKDHYGSEAIAFYKNGEMDRLKEYCLKDVELTKKLFDLSQSQGHLLFPDKITGEILRIEFRPNV